MANRETLEVNVKNAEEFLALAQQALLEFDCAPENNVFDTLEEAENSIENRLLNFAKEDCEGSYNCGSPTYEQEFIIGYKHPTRYIGRLSVEYNRAEKQYYYVDEYEFSVEEVQNVPT